MFTALLAAGMLAAGCDKSDDEKVAGDPYITVTPSSIDAGYEAEVFSLEVKSNNTWAISKTDSDGNPIDWVKCDRASGTGDLTLKVKVFANNTADARQATLTLFNDDIKAFIDVYQAGNPNPPVDPDPVIPDPGPDPQPSGLVLDFDFTRTDLGWPTSKSVDWHTLKNCDSGAAVDNGGTATENPHRRAQITYTIDGTGYDFTIADPDEAAAHNIYLSSEKGVYTGTLRYFGLPAISGKKLVKVEMVQNASTKDPSTFSRLVGIATGIITATGDVSTINYVSGGENQNQATNGETYTYTLTGTEANTVYWITATTNASIIKTLRLYYDDGVDPTPVTPDPTPVTPEEINLTFDFTGTPQEGWPTAAKEVANKDGGNPFIYKIGQNEYTFVLATCYGVASTSGVTYWQPPVDSKDGYLSIPYQYRYAGLPAIEGYALTKVVVYNSSMSTITPSMAITNKLAASTTDAGAITNDSDDIVKGGEFQEWDANGGKTYTYTLSGTVAGKMYYLYAKAKGGVAKFDLTYKKSE